MVDRYTKMVFTVIAVMLAGQLVRPLFETRTVTAQPPVCGTAATPCQVNIVGGPPGGAVWQGAPIFVFDAQAEARARTQPPCGAPAAPCHALIVGGPASLGNWQGSALIVIESQRIVPRTSP